MGGGGGGGLGVGVCVLPVEAFLAGYTPYQLGSLQA